MKQQSDDVMRERPRVETKRHRRGRRFVMAAGAVGLLACGVLGGIVASRYLDGGPRVPVASSPPSSPTAPTAPESPGASAPEAPAEVVLSPEAVSQAGIKTAPAEAAVSEVTVQLPGTVTAD